MSNEVDAPTLLTVSEVAEQLRVSKMTVYRMLHAGDLASIRVGRSFRIPDEAVRAIFDALRTSV
jgi:excisionase family DNA binding protein